MKPSYYRHPVKAPRLAGTSLRLVCGLLETPGINRLIAGQTFRDLGLPTLLEARADEGQPLRINDLNAVDSGVSTSPEQAAELFTRNAPRPMPCSHDYRQAYASGELKPSQLAESLISKTQSSNQATPPLRGIIAQHADDLLKQARASDERWRQNEPLSPLDGVPVAVKDEVDQTGYPTTVGTSFLGDKPASNDAYSVARLRAAGALLVGKANMHELGLGVTGINPHHGSARNPYNPAHASGGSSSGSAVSVASGLVPLALGADGGGSIRIPASLCGMYGLKPTFGRISEAGAAPLCWSVAHLGPIAASPADLALGLSVMAGPDPADALSLGRPSCDLNAASTGTMQGLRIGVYSPWFDDAQGEVVSACQEALQTLVDAGAELVEVVAPDPDLTRMVHMVTIVSEMLASQGPELRARRKHYGLDVRMNFALGEHLSSREYVHAQRLRNLIAAQTSTLFENVDFLATPSTGRTAPIIRPGAEARGESDLVVLESLMRFAMLANLTGLPAISCPVGYDSAGLPIGLQLMARPFAEGELLRSAFALDAAQSMRRPEHWFCAHPNFL
jgi:Asp-tRNA(Asn)/Glu-tRNA(Gln) amidotransferase A subunit family amidase